MTEREYKGQGNCLALVLRSEGLAALPLIATSVTRHVKVDAHATKIGSMILGEDVISVYNGF